MNTMKCLCKAPLTESVEAVAVMSSIVGSHQQVCHLLSMLLDGTHSHHSLFYEAAEFLNGHYHLADLCCRSHGLSVRH